MILILPFYCLHFFLKCPNLSHLLLSPLLSQNLLFKAGNTEEVKALQKKARGQILQNNKKFCDMVEDSFRTNNSRQMSKSLQAMTGCKPGKKSITADDQQKLANDLNEFYACSDDTDYSAEQSATLEEINQRKAECMVFTTEEVSNCFQKVNPCGECGPENTSHAILSHCHSSLTHVYTQLFLLFMDSGHIPRICKTSVIVSVPKKPSPGTFNDYRPVSLSSIPFKCLQ